MALNDLVLEKLGLEARAGVESPAAKLKPQKVATVDPEGLKQYAALAEEAGVASELILIEKLKLLLNEHDIPVFNLQEVIKYMDEKAAKESKDKCGWEWRPFRERDHRPNVSFGKKAERRYMSQGNIHTIPASDFYVGPYTYGHWESAGGGGAGGGGASGAMGGSGGNGGGFTGGSASTVISMTPTNMQLMQMQMQAAQQAQQIYPRYVEKLSQSPNKVYDYAIPLHALKKVALINKHFGDKVGVFVSDYALAPAIQYPDPFLMVMVANPRANKGVGRFVIDFWNEPGFGLRQFA